MELWLGALNLGLLYAFLATGSWLVFRVQGISDITVDGTFTFGAAVAAVLLAAGTPPSLATGAGFLAGAAGGLATGLIHTRLKVHSMLAGILVMTALYSVNLHVMGRANVPLQDCATVFSVLPKLLPGLHPELRILAGLLLVATLFWLGCAWLLGTDAGLSLRAAGGNAPMASAGGLNVPLWTLAGLMLANGLAGLSGALIAQYQGFADVGMGVGVVVLGMASVILGENLVRGRAMLWRILAVVLGSVLFRLMVALALAAGLNPVDLKLLTALFVLAALAFAHPGLRAWRERAGPRRLLVLGGALLLLAAAGLGLRAFLQRSGPKVRIGVLQVMENGQLDQSREGFLAEMARLGWKEGGTCTFLQRNAQGNASLLPTLLDSLVREKVDLVYTVSTPATQAAAMRVKDRPVVFSTIASPFVIKLCTTEADHLPHVTGCYGRAPVGDLLALVQKVCPRALRIGSVWDPSAANSVLEVAELKKQVEALPGGTFLGATAASSVDVGPAVQSLVQRRAEVLVLVSDNLVFSAFDAVVRTTRAARIPVFVSDSSRVKDGALAAVGYDYASVGRQGARIADRVLRGVPPARIPIERYEKTFTLVNPDMAKELGITFPAEVQEAAERSRKELEALRSSTAELKHVTVFYFAEAAIFEESIRGLRAELDPVAVLDLACAQGSFPNATAIAQDISRSKADLVVSFSTQALQNLARYNTKVPHVFATVTDPYRAGAARSATDHPAHLTGIQTFQPVEVLMDVIRQMLPRARRLGIVWNPSELNSELCRGVLKKECDRLGLELVEATVGSSADVQEAVRSVMQKRIDAFVTPGDTTLLQAMGSVSAMLKLKRIPLFTAMPASVDQGAIAAVGADYEAVGREAGRLALRVLRGEKPAGIPIISYAPDRLAINLDTARELGVAVPDAVVKRAAVVRGTR